jgi:NIPSNAP
VSWPPIVELRQYTLHPGQRDVLIDLFDREFIESQEALGMTVLGQFRDVDDPDRFVWLRGFRDMTTRAEGLAAFYGGPVWQRHRDVANATMIDSDNVLLLRPARPETGFLPRLQARPPRDTRGHGPGLVIATVYSLDAPAENDVVEDFSGMLKPALVDAGATVLAFFVSDERPNNFPSLPVREDETVLVWLAGFAESKTALEWGAERTPFALPGTSVPGLKEPPQRLRLAPTARSSLTGVSQGWSA